MAFNLKVRLTEDACGNVTLTPVSKRREKEIAASNAYDHRGAVFIQEARAEDWTSRFPRSAFNGRDALGFLRFNDGAVFVMDDWTFRHMCGGQSD